MTDCALPCFMFTCVPSGNVKLIPDIGSAASAKPSAPSAITGRNIEPVVSEDGSSRSYLALFWDSRICLFASPTLSPRACIHLVMPRWYTWISLRKEVRRTFESWLSRTRYFFHAHSYRSSAVILLKILIWRQRYNDKRTCTRLHRGYAYELSGEKNYQMKRILRYEEFRLQELPALAEFRKQEYECYNMNLLGICLKANLPKWGKHVAHDGQARYPSWASTLPQLGKHRAQF